MCDFYSELRSLIVVQFSLLLFIQKQIYTSRSSLCEFLGTKNQTRHSKLLLIDAFKHTHCVTKFPYVIINYCQIFVRLLKHKACFFSLKQCKIR
jgi:hypothetical protein